MVVVPSTSSLAMRRCLSALVFSVAIAGCGRLEYGSSRLDAGVRGNPPGADGSIDSPSPVDAATQLGADGGEVVEMSDSGPSLEPDAGREPTDAGALDSGLGPVDSGTASGCTPRCAREEYCSTPSGMCSAVGTCRLRPDACMDVFAPVVGCDGMNYSNSCYAAQAGTSVLSSGGI